jgi:hypothetical protein
MSCAQLPTSQANTRHQCIGGALPSPGLEWEILHCSGRSTPSLKNWCLVSCDSSRLTTFFGSGLGVFCYTYGTPVPFFIPGNSSRVYKTLIDSGSKVLLVKHVQRSGDLVLTRSDGVIGVRCDEDRV